MRVKLLKLELLDNPKVKVTADIQLGSLLVIHGIKLLRLDNGRMMVYIQHLIMVVLCALFGVGGSEGVQFL